VRPSVSVRPGAGAGGSDRVTLVWPDGAIVRRWLQVTMNPTANTALVTPDVFYVGNLPGEIGDNTVAAAVNPLDFTAVRASLNRLNVPIGNNLDFNRDGRINATDLAIVRGALGRSLQLLSTSGTAGAAPPAAQDSLFSQVPVARRRSAYRPTGLLEGPGAVL